MAVRLVAVDGNEVREDRSAEPTLAVAETSHAMGRPGRLGRDRLAETDDVAAAVRRGEEAVGSDLRRCVWCSHNVGLTRWHAPIRGTFTVDAWRSRRCASTSKPLVTTPLQAVLPGMASGAGDASLTGSKPSTTVRLPHTSPAKERSSDGACSLQEYGPHGRHTSTPAHRAGADHRHVCAAGPT